MIFYSARRFVCYNGAAMRHGPRKAYAQASEHHSLSISTTTKSGLSVCRLLSSVDIHFGKRPVRGGALSLPALLKPFCELASLLEYASESEKFGGRATKIWQSSVGSSCHTSWNRPWACRRDVVGYPRNPRTSLCFCCLVSELS